MHEIGLMNDALALALKRAEQEKVTSIRQVTFRIGDGSGVVPEVIEFAFSVATRGTLAEGAQLAIERVPVVCSCLACGEEFSPGSDDLPGMCPFCEQLAAVVRQGQEFELAYLDVA